MAHEICKKLFNSVLIKITDFSLKYDFVSREYKLTRDSSRSFFQEFYSEKLNTFL